VTLTSDLLGTSTRWRVRLAGRTHKKTALFWGGSVEETSE